LGILFRQIGLQERPFSTPEPTDEHLILDFSVTRRLPR
jgi:hypothetical protein